MAIMTALVPEAFAPEEIADYQVYLREAVEDYFVVEREGQILGGGGLNYGFDGGRTARLSWDLVAKEFQSQGIGQSLVLHRITFLRETRRVERVEVRTSQIAAPFYAKQGFHQRSVIENYWAPGFHLHRMQLAL